MGWWIIEIKWLFSIVILQFTPGCRENFHTQPFNSLTWWMSEAEEHTPNSKKSLKPGWIPTYTPRDKLHRINTETTTWAISIRGKWVDTLKEYNENTKTTIEYSHHRKITSVTSSDEIVQQGCEIFGIKHPIKTDTFTNIRNISFIESLVMGNPVFDDETVSQIKLFGRDNDLYRLARWHHENKK